MMEGYHRTFWVHAGNLALRTRPPDIPDRTLGIDLWEYLAPVASPYRLVPPEYARRVHPEMVAMSVDVRLADEETDPGWGSKLPPEDQLISGDYNYGPPLGGF